MRPNEPCWCRSGKKWKKCHKNRAQETPRNVNELLNGLRLEQTKGYCAHPDAGPQTCSGQPTDAHTIQKEGGLRAISENGHVISVKKGAFGMGKNKGEMIPVLDGIKNASTFPGFCNAHDAMFSPAEQATVALGQEVAFLLSYRTVVYERFLKEAGLRSLQLHRQEADRGRPFEEQAEIQQSFCYQQYGVELGLKDATRNKAEYDAAYRTSLKGFNFLGAEFSSVLPVVCSGAFFPDFDLFGQAIQSLASSSTLDAVAVNLTVLHNRSVLILGWIGSGTAPEKFASSYARLPDTEKANAAVRLALEYIENTYCRPSWWNGLSQADRDNVVASAETLEAPPVCRRGPDGRCTDGRTFAAADLNAEMNSFRR